MKTLRELAYEVASAGLGGRPAGMDDVPQHPVFALADRADEIVNLFRDLDRLRHDNDRNLRCMQVTLDHAKRGGSLAQVEVEDVVREVVAEETSLRQQNTLLTQKLAEAVKLLTEVKIKGMNARMSGPRDGLVTQEGRTLFGLEGDAEEFLNYLALEHPALAGGWKMTPDFAEDHTE